MRLPYDKIFLDGGGAEDSEIVACGLTAAYMRLLLSAAGDYFSFYQGDERVSLSDTEEQIIESGRAELSRLFIEGVCSVDKVVFRGTPPNGHVIETGVTTNVAHVTSQIDTEYASWDGTILTLQPGFYTVEARCRIDGTNSPPFGFRQIMTLQNELSQTLDVDDNFCESVGASMTINYIFFITSVGGVQHRYFQSSGRNMLLAPGRTSLRVVRHG